MTNENQERVRWEDVRTKAASIKKTERGTLTWNNEEKRRWKMKVREGQRWISKMIGSWKGANKEERKRSETDGITWNGVD